RSAPRIDGEPVGEVSHHHVRDLRVAVHEGIEVALVENEQSRQCRDPRCGRAREVVDEGELTEGLAGRERAQDVLALHRLLCDLHRALDDEEERPAWITLLEDDLTRVIRLLQEACSQPGEESSRQTRKQGRACKKRCATGLLRVSRKGEPSPQVLLQHAANYIRRPPSRLTPADAQRLKNSSSSW